MTKTKTNLSTLITSCNFDWVSPEIEKKFTAEKVRGELKVFHFNRAISSQDAIKEIEKKGYAPASLTELLAYAKDGWNGEDWVVALGSVAEVYGDRRVPNLRRSDSERRLSLFWWGGGWSDDFRFLAVRNSVSQTLKTNKLAKALKEAGFPQKGKGWYSGKDLDAYVPTLEELIEACPRERKGMAFDLCWLGDEFVAWYEPADRKIIDRTETVEATGKTALDAVGNLWLALNPKK